MRGPWPLQGRQGELEDVGRWLAGTSAGVLLAGDAGVGKTRLAGEGLAAEAAAGRATLWLVATSAAATVPLAVFADLLPAGPVVERGRIDVFRGVADRLRERSAGGGLVLAVDDVHLLDEASAALLLHLAVDGAARLLLTMRSGAPTPDAVMALWKDGIVERLDLRPLGRDEVATLLASVLGGQVESVTAERLWESTAGNVLFLRELVEDLLRTGDLRDDGRIWNWAGPITPGPRLSELVEARLGRLEGDRRLAVELLAVGESLAPGLVAQIAGPQALSPLERDGVVITDHAAAAPEVRLGHPLYGEVLRAQMGVTRRSQLCGMLAQSLAATLQEPSAIDLGASMHARSWPVPARTTGPNDVLRLAQWAFEAGAPVTPELLTQAASVATDRLNHALAEQLARGAVSAGGGFAAHLALGEALHAQGRGQEAAAVCAAIVDPPPSDLAQARLSGLHSLAARECGDIETALAVLELAERRVADPHIRASVRANRARALRHAGRREDAVTLAAELLDAPDTDELARIQVVETMGMALAAAGQTERALALAQSLIEPAFRLREAEPLGPGWVSFVWFVALLYSGRLQEASGLLDVGESGTGPAEDLAAAIRIGRGRIALAEGRPVSAARYLREGVVTFRERRTPGFLPWTLSLLGEAYALSGDTESAAAAADEAASLANPALRAFETDIARARAWVVASRGELTMARSISIDAATLSRESGEFAMEVQALHDAVRLGARGQAVSRLVELRGVVDGAWPPACADHAVALAAGDGPGLDRAAEAFRAIGALRLAAEAAAEAAAAHRRQGLAARASASASRSAGFQAKCEGSSVPPLEGVSAGQADLTRREREIATLAASGLSNAQIAERLLLSKRTVEGHLYRLYMKLGVSDRKDLIGGPRPAAEDA